ncbi:MAG: hypothetical protein JRI23_00830 [Deltaproteobacteria bacterium]|nr:hypothetical protein [Deltaproteobacteria bacterium]MBW2529997.1 hypothetical protein [Deltaproteobacteria bacterium]
MASFVMLLGLASLGASCGTTAVSIMPGVVNDTGNRSLRRALLSFATGTLCMELQARTIPLTLRADDPALGRFFPTTCSVQELANDNLFVQFSGHGYGWSNLTGRIGFEAAGAVEYRHDFLMDGSTMYVYFRQKQTQSSDFRVYMVERGAGVPSGGVAGAAIAQVLGTSVASAAQQIGVQILEHQLAQGFTVVRESDATVTFTLGLLEKGARPALPFDRGESDWTVLANERTELHVGQRDYTGPYTITDDDEALYLTALLEGAPKVDVLVIGKGACDPWIQSYERQPAAPAPPVAPISDETIEAAQPVPNRPPPLWRRTLRLPPGSYYVVFDNTSSAGQTAPTPRGMDDRAALLSYAVQLGDAP